ncbi:MAG: 2-C-methyl-D-erythritol 4-phosphate cytidylyltransferase [Chthoniobacterales bacterium]
MAGTEPMPSFAAVIVAAGSSRRMGFDKVLTLLAGEPMLRHSVRAFEICAAVTEIVVVCAKEREVDVRSQLGDVRKLAGVVAGGDTRQESVCNGLAAITSEFVAVHDAARPLVTAELITHCFEAAVGHGAAVAAEPVTDTLQRADATGSCEGIVEREGLWRMQTPQVFRTAEIRRAMESVRASGASVTDETSALQRVGGRVFLVENDDWNFKVTYPRDVAVAEFILQSRAAASLT